MIICPGVAHLAYAVICSVAIGKICFPSKNDIPYPGFFRIGNGIFVQVVQFDPAKVDPGPDELAVGRAVQIVLFLGVLVMADRAFNSPHHPELGGAHDA